MVPQSKLALQTKHDVCIQAWNAFNCVETFSTHTSVLQHATPQLADVFKMSSEKDFEKLEKSIEKLTEKLSMVELQNSATVKQLMEQFGYSQREFNHGRTRGISATGSTDYYTGRPFSSFTANVSKGTDRIETAFYNSDLSQEEGKSQENQDRPEDTQHNTGILRPGRPVGPLQDTPRFVTPILNQQQVPPFTQHPIPVFMVDPRRSQPTNNSDFHAQYEVIKNPVSRIILEPDFILNENRSGITSDDREQAAIISRSAQFVETELKLMQELQVCFFDEQKLASVLDQLHTTQKAHMRYLQEEYSSLQVAGQFGPQTRSVFKSLRKQTSTYTTSFIDDIKTAVSVTGGQGGKFSTQQQWPRPPFNPRGGFRGGFRGWRQFFSIRSTRFSTETSTTDQRGIYG